MGRVSGQYGHEKSFAFLVPNGEDGPSAFDGVGPCSTLPNGSLLCVRHLLSYESSDWTCAAEVRSCPLASIL